MTALVISVGEWQNSKTKSPPAMGVFNFGFFSEFTGGGFGFEFERPRSSLGTIGLSMACFKVDTGMDPERPSKYGGVKGTTSNKQCQQFDA